MGRVSTARQRLIEATTDLIWTESYGSVSVDAICERARVKKGSFYHFFKSKDDLVIAALDAHWEARKPTLDKLFAPSRAPLDRLRAYFDSVYERQVELAKKFGRPPGCFYCKLGIEVSQETEIGRKVQAIMAAYVAYYESALAGASAEGAPLDDIPGKARALFAFMEGVLTQARINDDFEIMRNLGKSAFRFLGLGEVMAA
ncbi:MAG TPA: TetR/AcrR family transcriptional regulator [Polyangia bacterium]|nr:TetR/AcrR family transcriptional regulator [Polyangia bacterium]